MNSQSLTRPSVPQFDAILGDPFAVLDHGHVRLIDYMGDEAAIVQAARVSYGAGTTTPSSDRGLIRYLMRRYHTTPFEMCEIKLHVKLPIFVARQWIRHRTANVNEYSARYSILMNEFHVPRHEDLAPQSSSNKQGREGGYDYETADLIRRVMAAQHDSAYETYTDLIDEADPNLARETARGVLPMNTYTEWFWKIDLHNLLHFLRLRADPHAQKEIRDYAAVICNLVELWMPNVWEAFTDYHLEAMTLTRMEVAALKTLIYDDDLGAPKLEGASDRESNEWAQKLKRLGVNA